MDKSESIKNLAIALAKFQGEVNNPANTATNPFFKSKYAPLAEVINTIKPILSKYGLSIVQAPSTEGDNINMTTILMHESGEWIESPALSLKMDKITAQGAGSAITYARRYALSAMLGISSEDDDDGNQVSEAGNGKKDTPKTSKQSKPNKTGKNNLATSDQLNFIYNLAKEKKYDNKSMNNYIKSAYQKNSSKELTKQEASELIEMLQSLSSTAPKNDEEKLPWEVDGQNIPF